MSKTKACRHSKIEVYEDSDGRGHFAECGICEGVGPLKKTSVEARRAMQKLKIKRPSNQGGLRKGSGRKKVLPKDAKFVGLILFPKHYRKIERFIKKFNKTASEKKQVKSRSAGVRQILDDLRV